MAVRRKHTDRELMELAVEVMRQSVPEPRGDGKASPKVGAVLVMPDGTVQTACRGELRHGDHAEFALLERKNRGNKLDGSTLFTTLEPCAPGARCDPKIDCAERIRLARIKKVWIGIQDPDPKVARKGILHLENSGIEVAMFDRDLQEIIEEENADFLKQANDRAAAAQKAPAKILLSPLENKFALAMLDDFATEALEFYRDRAGINAAVGSSETGVFQAINQANMARLAAFSGPQIGIGPNIGPFWPDIRSRLCVKPPIGQISGHYGRILRYPRIKWGYRAIGRAIIA